jgi:hypothetical protein
MRLVSRISDGRLERRTEMNNDEVLILSDGEGIYYEIPREVVEQHRVSDERKAEIEAAAGDDVSGYSYDSYFIKEHIVASRQAEMREQGGRERMLKAARQEEATEADEPVNKGILFGAFVRRLVPRRT